MGCEKDISDLSGIILKGFERAELRLCKLENRLDGIDVILAQTSSAIRQIQERLDRLEGEEKL